MITRTAALAAALAGCASGDLAEDLDVGSESAAVTVCADGPTVPGIDVSRYQDTIDWAAVAGTGTAFAFMRATLGETYVDPFFADNWAAARANGILRSPYHYLIVTGDPLVQADHFLATVGQLEPGDLPPLLDVEDPDGIPDPATYVAMVQTWVDRVEGALGVKPVIYSGKYYWQDYLASSDAFLDHPFFLAQYRDGCPDTPSPYTRWNFWQYTSEGSVGGIGGFVDRDTFNGSIDDLRALTLSVECGDGVCGGGENADGCPADCPPCQVIAADGETIVDDTSICFKAGGPAASIRSVDSGWDAGSKWTYTTDDVEVANYGLWNLHFAEAGRYRLEVYTPAEWAQSVLSQYQVVHQGGPTSVPVDQTANDGWQAIGEFEFAAGSGQSVRVDDNTGEPLDAQVMLSLDALRLTRLDGGGDGDGGDGDGGDGGDGGDDGGSDDQPVGDGLSGGCAAGGESSWLGLLLVGLFMFARRRR